MDRDARYARSRSASLTSSLRPPASAAIRRSSASWLEPTPSATSSSTTIHHLVPHVPSLWTCAVRHDRRGACARRKVIFGLAGEGAAGCCVGPRAENGRGGVGSCAERDDHRRFLGSIKQSCGRTANSATAGNSPLSFCSLFRQAVRLINPRLLSLRHATAARNINFEHAPHFARHQPVPGFKARSPTRCALRPD